MGKVNPIGESTGAKTQNEEWLANDIKPTKNAKFRTTVSVDAAVTIQVTLDSGTTWNTLNNNIALVANNLYLFDIGVRLKDQFNIRIPTAGGATINVCRIDEVSGEG